MSRFKNRRTANLTPYVPGEQPKDGMKYIKLNTNECPYPPSPSVIEAVKNACNDTLRLYPSPNAYAAKKAFAETFGVLPSNIFVGNGSDEVLGFAFMTFFDNDKDVLIPDISYSFYPVYCNISGVKYREIPVKDDFTIDVDSFINTKGDVVIANPNAPTSISIPVSEIERIIVSHKDDLVIIDEAYVDFGGESAVNLIDKYDNLLVIRTLSKAYALAGMRIGFAIGNRELIDDLNIIKDSFNSYTVDRLAICAAQAAMEDGGYYEDIISKVVNTRSRVKEELLKIGFTVLNSSTNFLFISHNRKSAEWILGYLRNNGVLVRHFKVPRIDNFLRVTIGTDEEMNRVLDLLRNME